MRDLIFVYGTLRPGQPNHPLIEHLVDAHTPAQLPGHVLKAHPRAAFPYATADDHGLVVGELLQLAVGAGPEVLNLLDVLEGYRAESPDSSHYLRVRRLATAYPGRRGATAVEAWVYLAGPRIDLSGVPEVEGGDWTTRGLTAAGRWS